MLILFFFLHLFHLISWQTAVSCAIIAGFCCPLVITMMPASNDAGKAGVGRLVHVGVSKDKSLTVATQVNVHSHSWF